MLRHKNNKILSEWLNKIVVRGRLVYQMSGSPESQNEMKKNTAEFSRSRSILNQNFNSVAHTV